MSKLTPKQQAFVEEYLIDLNATQAAIRAGYSKKTARQIAEQNLSKLDIQNAISNAQRERSARTNITQDAVLKRYWSIATANPNDLVVFRRVNCRYCWGTDHYYQWKNQTEYQEACDVAKRARPKRRIPDCDGGFGFDRTRVPHPDCPDCKGEGVGETFVKDTQVVTGDATLLYAGIKETQYGIEVKMHDQMTALNKVAEHLGMFKQQVEHTGPNGGPIQQESTTTIVATEEQMRQAIGALDDKY